MLERFSLIHCLAATIAFLSCTIRVYYSARLKWLQLDSFLVSFSTVYNIICSLRWNGQTVGRWTTEGAGQFRPGVGRSASLLCVDERSVRSEWCRAVCRLQYQSSTCDISLFRRLTTKRSITSAYLYLRRFTCEDEREVGTEAKVLALACADGGPGGGGQIALYALRSRSLVARPGLGGGGGGSYGEFTSCTFASAGADSAGPLLVSGTASSHLFVHDFRRLEYFTRRHYSFLILLVFSRISDPANTVAGREDSWNF